MRADQFIRKIRIYALISFFLPLIIINLCLFIFKFLGDFHTYPTFNWDEKKIEQPYKEYIAIYNNFESWTLTNCPKYKYSTYDYTIDNQIIKSTEENSGLPHKTETKPEPESKSEPTSDIDNNYDKEILLDAATLCFGFQMNVPQKCTYPNFKFINLPYIRGNQ